MAEQTQSRAERYANTEVVDAPDQESRSGQTVASPEEAVKAPAEGSSDKSSRAERYAGFEVIDADTAYRHNVGDATENILKATEEDRYDLKGKERVSDWMGDAGRASLLGPLARPIGALYLSQIHFKDMGISYQDAMDSINERDRNTKNTSATITGSIVSGAFLARGLTKLTGWAATKSGIVDGAIRWASKDKVLNRVLGAAAIGGGTGFIEEGVRTTLEESVDAHNGEGFDVGRVVDNVFVGTLIGAAATPALQEGINGVKWMAQFIGKQKKGSEAEIYDATKRIMKSFAREGDTLDQAADKFREKVMAFRATHGRMPAAGEVMAPEQVRNVAEVGRAFNGIDQRARELSEEGVDRALKDYDRIVTEGGKIPSPMAIEHQIDEIFTDVMTRHGSKKVEVDEETMVYLGRNRDWLRTVGQDGNDGAKALSKILDAQSDIGGLRKKYSALTEKVASASRRSEVADLNEELALLLDEAFREAGADASKIAELRNLVRLKKAIGDSLDSGRNATDAGFNLDDFKPQLKAAMEELDKYAENGAKITLSDANHIRKLASKQANDWMKAGNPDKAAQAKRVRDAVAPIGTKEVAEYGKVVKRWNLEKNRIEAQPVGKQAAEGTIDPMDLETVLKIGKVPGKPRVEGHVARESIREGAAEGSRRVLQHEVRGTAGEGLASARRVASNSNVQNSLGQTLGEMDAKQITKTAKMVEATYKSMKELAAPNSPSQAAEEIRQASDIVTGAVFGNLGGAGRAHLLVRMMTGFKIPRGVARKTVEMLGDPGEIDKALAFMQKKGIRVGPLFSAIINTLHEPVDNGR